MYFGTAINNIFYFHDQLTSKSSTIYIPLPNIETQFIAVLFQFLFTVIAFSITISFT